MMWGVGFTVFAASCSHLLSEAAAVTGSEGNTEKDGLNSVQECDDGGDTCSSEDTIVDNQIITYFSDDLPLVVLDWNELSSGVDLQKAVAKAYDSEGLGILLVKNVPGLEEKRDRLLRLSYELAHLSEVELKELEHPQSYYSVGWSHGKEKLSKDMPDYSKASFYGNPIKDEPRKDDPSLVKEYPAFYHPNLWPVKSLPGLRQAFMDLGQLIQQTGMLVSRQCDALTVNERGKESYQEGTLINVVSNDIPKARLLYYYSMDEMSHFWENHPDLIKPVIREDDWCGWHNDHSSLTGLALGMFFNTSLNGETITDTLNDENAGLYLKTRRGKNYRIQLSEEDNRRHLAFQMGETSQILSGGVLYATPHSVRGPKASTDVSRASFAVFMQPDHTHHMRAPPGLSLAQIQFDRHLPPSVPALAKRWDNRTGDTFGQFTHRTLTGYY